VNYASLKRDVGSLREIVGEIVGEIVTWDREAGPHVEERPFRAALSPGRAFGLYPLPTAYFFSAGLKSNAAEFMQ
jgi:hypothetical protein